MVKKSILAKVGDKINYKLIRDGYKTDKGNIVVTAEMDTKSTITADVPSTSYASNLDYEVDISGENPPIINIKNDITCPDDTIISKGKYLFYDIGQEYDVKNTIGSIEKIFGIKDYTLNDDGTELTTKLFDYHYKEEIPYKFNLTKIGNVSVNSDGTVSNFSTSNYLRMLDKPSSSTTNFEMLFHFKCTSFSNSEILMGDSGNTWDNVLIYVFNNRFQIGNNSNWYKGTHDISLNKEYYVKVIFNNGTLSSYISEDGITYEQDYTGSLSSYNWKYNANIGYSSADNVAFKGTIWLEDCYIQYDNDEKKYFVEKPRLNDKASLYINPEKDNNLYYEKDELQLNVSKVGSCVIDKNGVASNFADNSYVTFGKLNTSDDHWEMVFKVKYKEHSGFQRVCGPSDDKSRNLLITVSDEDKLSLYLSANGSDWSIQRKDSKTTLVNDVTYYIKALFNRTNYILSLSTDGINYTEEINETSTTPMYNGVSTNFQIGCAFSDKSKYNWQGTIDLKESYIQIGTDEKKYFAEKVKKRYNIPSLYSEFIDNITIPAHALYDYIDGEWKLSSTSPFITQDITVNADNAEITMKEIEE